MYRAWCAPASGMDNSMPYIAPARRHATSWSSMRRERSFVRSPRDPEWMLHLGFAYLTTALVPAHVSSVVRAGLGNGQFDALYRAGASTRDELVFDEARAFLREVAEGS